MASYAYHQEASAPPMYPVVPDRIQPIPPVRSEFARDPQEQTLLPPQVPERMDKPSTRSYADTGLRRVNIKILIEVFLKRIDYITVITYNSFFINTKQNQLVLFICS